VPEKIKERTKNYLPDQEQRDHKPWIPEDDKDSDYSRNISRCPQAMNDWTVSFD
jgi:hypothetical protein